ncbi:hypothetical protein [Dictyobacter arantiisoli]|uniref:Uncharacterized protein n=1 Tax=Dictyobacter arantiisoli TaxID=2014874 RepID=A0A5A5T9Z2_9CHLR|nr:hypothetical protein [Dictyobacter arantiisoli]GCF07833.1 hypothetical protein KDI_13970 [Dictyobacter arantiisoli]
MARAQALLAELFFVLKKTEVDLIDCFIIDGFGGSPTIRIVGEPPNPSIDACYGRMDRAKAKSVKVVSQAGIACIIV